MQQFAAKRSQPFLPDLELFRGGLGLELFALIDQRINDVGLASVTQLLTQERDRFAQLIARKQMRDYFAPAARHLVNRRNFEVAVNGHG